MTDIYLNTKIMQAQLAAFGQKGHEVLVNADGETAADSVYFAIVATEESEIDYHDRITDTSVSGLTIPAGFQIVGELDLITVNSGTIIAYIGDLKVV